MKRNCLIILVMVFLLSSLDVTAQNGILAGDLTWNCVGNDSFIIKFVLYRDCNGAKFPKSVILNVEDAKTGQKITDLIINQSPPIDITPTCQASCTRCQDSACSFPYGIEQYTYTKFIAFDHSVSSCELRISFSTCCRSDAITTGPGGSNFYIEAILNRCLNPCDNSPSFTNPPIAIICKNQDLVFCNGIIDIDIDVNTGGLIDSLSYEWTSPLTAKSSAVSYNSPFSYDKPISFWGFPDTNLTLPKGFHLDKYTSLISFRPVDNNFTVFSLKIKEWRKINNIMTQIGELTRNYAIIVVDCPHNNQPLLGGPYFKEIFAGETVAFSIGTNDYDTEDSLIISYHGSIPGAIWTSNNHQVKHPTGTFIWQTTSKDARIQPYTFTVSVTDRKCPIPGINTRVYQVLVKDNNNSSIDNFNFGKDIKIYPNPSSGNITIETTDFQWVKIIILNSYGKTIKEIITPLTNKHYLETDILPSGIYFLRLTDINGNSLNQKLIIK